MGKLRDNLVLQINALEAQSGLEPRIQRSKYIKPVVQDIDGLRREKTKLHLHHLQKVLNRSFKKAKTFTVQRIVKKLKKLKEEGKGEEVLKMLEEELARVKAYKPVDTVVFGAFLKKCSEYSKEKCSFLEVCQDEAADQVALKIMQNNAFNAELNKQAASFEQFLKKLYHENEPSPAPTKTPQDKPKRERRERKRVIDSIEDDDEAAGASRKRNRLGQAARRKLAEEKYGDQAKHLRLNAASSSKKEKKRYYENKDKQEEPVKTKDEELHPSWQARREVKEKMSKVKFEGKSIKFEDADE